jgi:predicted kinase
MVCDALLKLAEWRNLPEPDREILFAAALLHDVAKPLSTKIEDGRVTSRGHSLRGSIQARRILWENGADFKSREQVCALVRHHQTPFHLIDRPAALRDLRRISQSTRCDLLAILASADALGRQSADQSTLLSHIGLFTELCRENDCLDRPWQFPSSLSRFEYFQREDRDPHYHAHDQSRCEVVLMSGLPASGKDSWIRRHAPGLPMISLDEIREEIGAPPVGNQGPVVQLAKDRARDFLRQGTGFVWNATNLTRDYRSPLIDLFTRYNARVRIVYVEAPSRSLFLRNEQRERVVPRQAIEQMMDRWEIADPSEAPVVEWWENGKSWTAHRQLI